VTESNKPSSGFIISPCKNAKNQKNYSSIKSLHNHLFKWGFMPNYFVWTCMDKAWIMKDDEDDDDNIPDWSHR
jgi:hypothetical protein